MPPAPLLSDFVSAGYFLIRADHPGWDQLKSDLLPDQFISLSSCFCPRLNVAWGWIPGDRQAALDFGIPLQQVDAFLAWCKQDYKEDLAMWGMFHSPDAARRTVERFQIDRTNLHIIGVGYPRELLENWQEEYTEPGYGIPLRIGQRLPLADGGKPLGFDVASYGYGDIGHSWLCSGLYDEMYRLFGIRPNQNGLIDCSEDAQEIFDWIAEDELQGTRSEPEPYFVWLLVDYRLD